MPLAAHGRLLRAEFSGTERERARAHGELMRERIRETAMVPYYRSFCFRFVPPKARLQSAAVEVMHAGFARLLSHAARETTAGFAEAMGIGAEEARRSFVMPDVLNALAGLSRGKGRTPPGLGCTSVAAWGPYTSDGRLLYGRNLDFCGVGVWDRYPLVARHRPKAGIPYVSVSSAGIVADGVTGLNEEGLSVALHQHCTSDVLILGRSRPILDLAAEVLRTCRTLEEAVALVARHPTTSGWTVALTSAKERRACAVERSAARWSRRDFADGLFVRANGYEDPALRRAEFPYPTLRASSEARTRKPKELLEAARGRVDAAALAGALSSRAGAAEEPVYSQGVVQPNSLVSVVFDPERGEAWVGEDTAPVSGGRLRRISLWDDRQFDETLESPVPGQRRLAELAYSRAYAGWEARGTPEASLGALDEAVSRAPKDAYMRVVRGFLRLRAGEPNAAAEDLATAAAFPDIPHRRASALLWLARAEDARGRRAEALAAYRGALEQRGEDARLNCAAERGLAEPYALACAASVLPDFNLGDTYSY